MTYIRRWLRWLGALLTAWGTPAQAPEDTTAIEAAVCEAFVSVGLPREQFGPTFDLLRTGKMHEVIHHAGVTLGIDHGLRTVGDVVALLLRAKS
jgi:hypothetical protein